MSLSSLILTPSRKPRLFPRILSTSLYAGFEGFFLAYPLFAGEFANVFAGHAGVSTTLPSFQTMTGTLKARCWALTLRAARFNARSARMAKAGGLRVARFVPFFFIGRARFASIECHPSLR